MPRVSGTPARVLRLGYIGYDVTDQPAWRGLLSDVLGLEARSDGPGAIAAYRMDRMHHRIMLHDAPSDRLRYVGWEVVNAGALEALTRHIAASGMIAEQLDQADCALRAIERGIRFAGPDGVPTELFVTSGEAEDWRSPVVRHGFKTGPEGMGHVVIAAAEPRRAVDWYRDMLGFALSDKIAWDEAEGTFMHCNARHHSLAILNCCFGHRPGDLNHILLEMNDLDDLGRTYDRVIAANVPIALSLGRHSNDRMISFYVVTPGGSAIEVGYGGISSPDEGIEPVNYDSPKLWGHLPTVGARV